MRQDLDLPVQLKRLYGERAHDVPDEAGVERAGVFARRDDACGLKQQHYAVLLQMAMQSLVHRYARCGYY